jgi:hypothetical protein
MKTYYCFYVELIEGESSRRGTAINAESPSEAYEAFLAKEGTYQIPVSIDPPGVFTASHVFEDHIGTPEDKEAQRTAKETRREIKEATTNAHSSLSSTDILLKKLIAKQDETNQRLRKIRWCLLGILVILAIWNIRVFG